MDTKKRFDVSASAPTEMGIDYDAEQKRREGETARATIIDTDGPAVLEAFRAHAAEAAVTQLGDRALAEKKRGEVKRDLPPTIAVDAVNPSRPVPEKRIHTREEIAAYAETQGVKVTPPETKKAGFFQNLLNAPRDAWRMLQGKPPEYSQKKREPISDSTPIPTFETAPTKMGGVGDPGETTFFRVEPRVQTRVETGPTPEQQEYARLNALRETLVGQGLLDRDGEPSEQLRLYPDRHGVGPGDQEKLSRMQRDRFLTESRTVNG